MYKRQLEALLKQQVKKGKSVLLLGPRQVGKTTLCRILRFDLEINLASMSERLKFEKDPERLERLVLSSSRKQFVYIDEIQKIPSLFNSIQVLIDSNKAQFVLTGSSSRKIKQQMDVNLAPGRLVHLYLDTLSYAEYSGSLDEMLSFGQLPAICREKDRDQRELELQSYVESYIEEEIRKETRIRQVAHFARFIELAALQSGKISNFSEISKDLGPTVITIQNYYEILVDTLFAVRVDPYLKNATRKKLTKSSRYLFFDLGVRRVLADESIKFKGDRKGELFEHFIGNEIQKWIHLNARGAKLYFWRDPDGPEVDWLVEWKGEVMPIEVKLHSHPELNAAKHLKVFLGEYKEAKRAVIVSTSDIRYKLNAQIQVIPYQELFAELDRWKALEI